MPYEWTTPTSDSHELRLWPHRSLTRTGFVWFVGGTAALISLPLVTLIGEPVLWGLLPFVVGAVVAVWCAITRNGRDRSILEQLSLSRDTIRLTRRGPRGDIQSWDANPYWVRVQVHATGGPVPHYVTLNGNGREVEIGAFLSEEERLSLGSELGATIARLR